MHTYKENYLKVVKRDGVVAQFDNNRIYLAIQKAANAASQTIENIEDLVSKIISKFEGKEQVTVEDIQSAVEHTLLVSKYKETAKKYIEYRHERDIFREGNGKLLKDIQQFLDRTSDEFTNENSNKDSLAVNTHRDLIAGIVSKHYAVTQLMPKDVATAHKQGFIWQHDTDYYVSPLTNCCLINYPDMLENGFKIGDAEIEKPKSIGVATTILTQIVQAVASSQYGK